MTLNSLAQASSSKIQGFLSYSHESDSFLKIAEPLHRDLVNVIKLRSNLDIEIFRDRKDIQWGDRWKSTIDNGLTSASVLFVVATTHYLASNNCREEFLDFLNAAKSSKISGARRLILPIMPMAAPTIYTKDSEDEVAKEIADIQFELIEDAVIAGADSPEWRKAIIRLADRFIEVVTQIEAEAEAEATKTKNLPSEVATKSGEEDDSEIEPEASDERGYLDALSDVEGDVKELTSIAKKMSGLMQSVIEPMQKTDFGSISSPREMNAKFSLVAHAMSEDSRKIGEAGRALRDKTNSIDISLRHLVRLAKENEDSIAAGVYGFLTGLRDSLNETETVEQQMNALLISMAPAEAASSLMRNALKPMRSGIVAFSDAVGVIRKWGPEMLD